MTRRVKGTNSPLFIFLFGVFLMILGGVSRDVLSSTWIHVIGSGWLMIWVAVVVNVIRNPAPPRRLGRGGF